MSSIAAEFSIHSQPCDLFSHEFGSSLSNMVLDEFISYEFKNLTKNLYKRLMANFTEKCHRCETVD